MNLNELKPQFILVMGGAGSGKNYYISQKFPNFTLIDVDAIKGDVGVGAAINAIRPMMEKAFAAKKNVAHPTTGSNLKAQQNKLALAKQAGYSTMVVFIDTPIERALEQVRKRYREGGHDVEIEKIISSNKKARENFDALKGVADSSLVHRNASESINEAELHQDNPRGEWLKHQQATCAEAGTNAYGAPLRFGATTADFEGPVVLPVEVLSRIKGVMGEQDRTRYTDLASLVDYMGKNNHLPLNSYGKEYLPFITVDYTGTPWVNEGNHRIKAAKELGWKWLPVRVHYFAGGELADGMLSPDKVEKWDAQGQVERKVTITATEAALPLSSPDETPRLQNVWGNEVLEPNYNKYNYKVSHLEHDPTVLGAGAEAVVVTHPAGSSVVKIFGTWKDIKGCATMQYLLLSKKYSQTNPYFPQIMSVKQVPVPSVHGPDLNVPKIMFAIEMEQLHELEETPQWASAYILRSILHKDALDKMRDIHRYDALSDRISWLAEAPRHWNQVKDQNLLNALKLIRKVHSRIDTCAIDLHPGNMMVRYVNGDPQLVLTDPLID